MEAGQYVRPGFSLLVAITCACEYFDMLVSQAPRRDTSTEISSKAAQTGDSLVSGNEYGNGNDPVVLTNETARNETTARAYLRVPVARLAEHSQ